MLRRFGKILLAFVVLNLFLPVQSLSEPQVLGTQVNVSAPVIFAATPDTPDPNQLLTLVNRSRIEAGVPPLRPNTLLAELATRRASDMVQRQYFAHKNPDGRYYYDLLPTYGVDPDYSCENLDLIFAASNQGVVNDWLGSSKGHRECLLNASLVEAGYATAKIQLVDVNGQPSTAYVVVAIHATTI